MKPIQTVPGNSRRAGFSLIEVTIAIGIASFAVLPIFGTLSVGMTAIHDAKIDMTHAQVIAQVTSTVVQTPFDSIESDGPFYFDQEGRQLDTVSGALYSGTFAVISNGAATYPGAPSELNTSAKTVQITVSSVQPGTTHVLSSSRTSLLVPKS